MLQTANSSIVKKPIIFQCVKKVKLFDDKHVKNRRFRPDEFETELEIAKWLKRPPRAFINDAPFYPWVPPEPYVNFHLNYTE